MMRRYQTSSSVLMVVALTLLLVAATHTLAQTVIPFTNLGVSVPATLTDKGWVYYSVNPSLFSNLNDTDFVSFMLTSLSGDADLHVSIVGLPNGPDCTNCIFSSETPFSEVQTISKGDSSKWPTGNNPFYVGIYGYTQAEVVFNVWSSKSIVQLTEGQPQQANTERGTYTYFRYDLQRSAKTNITISVTPVDGDPDIYVSTKTDKPDRYNYEYSSALYGFDLININHDPEATQGVLSYYIGVYSYSNTHYTIFVRNHLTPAVRVVEGHPMSDLVEAGEMLCFAYENLVQQRILVSLSPLTSRGDPDLYIRWGDCPTTSSYDIVRRTTGNDAVEIEKADSQAGRIMFIGAYGYARDTKFELLVTTEEHNTILSDGVAFGASLLTGETNYYKYSHGDTDSSVVANVRVLRGSVKLYSAFHARPNQDKYERVAEMDGGLINMIFPAPTKSANYYFGVVASANADYTITVSSSQVPSILRDGVDMFWNVVPQYHYRHFIFEAADFATNDVSITVNPWIGDVDIYVSTDDENFPTKTNYTWMSDSWGEDTVHIPANDPKAKGKNRFRISVYGYREVNYFTILAMQSNTTIALVDDETVPGAVAVRDYVFYSYELAAPSTISISLHISSANSSATIFYSRTNPKPNRQDHDGTALTFGDAFLTLEQQPKGTIYISVHGWNSITGRPILYTLNVRTSYQHIYVNGQSYLVHVGQGKTTQFKAYIGSHIKTLVASATLVSGSTKMYIANDNSPANNTHFTFQNTEWPGNAFLIQNSNPDFKSGYWFFGVYGNVDSDFYISLTAYPYVAWMSEGVPVLGKAPTDGSPLIYSFWIPYTADDSKQDYSFHIRQISGYTDVYALQDYTINPSPQNFTFISSGSVDRTLTLPKDKITFGRAIYFGVYGKAGSDGSYPVYEVSMATASAPKFLGQDQPQSLVVTKGSYNYFETLNRYASDKLTVYVESCNVYPAPNIYVSHRHFRPNDQTADTITSTASSDYPHDYVQVASVDAAPVDKFFIGVGNAKSDSVSSIYVTTGDDARPSVLNTKMDGADLTSNGETVLILQPAKPSSKQSPGTLLSYAVYTAPIGHDQDESVLNMQTVCGVKASGNLVTKVAVTDTTQQVTAKFKVDRSQKYLVNVLAQDNNGLSVPYKAAYIINGRVVYAPISEGGVNVPALVISLILIFIFLAVLAYIGGGMGYRYKKGYRGIEMFPNYEFWKMVFTCGRSSSYTRFDDDRVNTSGFGSTNSSRQESQPITSGGYGSI
ncbi:hypothetical protein FDP41_009939 [Naegleria fowleri]|uniref:IgGFc-binding protein N-terminal domain-containing protein n=1 Tax=Naegleria fowleri TaxID=5763 RepID=A0A6A5BAB4_NAEFO|nr:uncharacterized protein FDP41_009939 [Naegleria fowleri]KAF0971716.1 hypothetical protein FDP41_009939 [Naegleria fowleri]